LGAQMSEVQEIDCRGNREARSSGGRFRGEVSSRIKTLPLGFRSCRGPSAPVRKSRRPCAQDDTAEREAPSG
jgi:hypothetical protein